MTSNTHELLLEETDRPQRANKQQRLREFLKTELESRRLKPGDPLPSEPSLAAALKISRGTLRQALASLEQEGWVNRIQGKGTFVRHRDESQPARSVDVFALIVPDTLYPPYMSLLSGFEAASGELDYQIVVHGSNSDVSKQAGAILQILDKGFAGVAIVPPDDRPTPAYQIRLLQTHGIPVVLCHRNVPDARAPLLAIPFRDVGRLVGEKLADLGHRRVGMLASLPGASLGYEEGLRESLEAVGGVVPNEFVYYEESSSLENLDETLYLDVVSKMMCKEDRPTALFVSDCVVGELIYLLLNRMGLHIPRDVSLIVEGGPWRKGPIAQKLTTVVVPETDIGRRAAQLLDEMRHARRPVDDNEVIPFPLMITEGETVGPLQ